MADQTVGFSGADITALVREAALQVVRKLQSAKKFKLNKTNGKFMPVEDYAEGSDI